MHRTLSEWVVERDGFYYQRTSDVPFTGTVSGTTEGSMTNGKREGEWRFYRNRKLNSIRNFKNDRQEGEILRRGVFANIISWRNGHRSSLERSCLQANSRGAMLRVQ